MGKRNILEGQREGKYLVWTVRRPGRVWRLQPKVEARLRTLLSFLKLLKLTSHWLACATSTLSSKSILKYRVRAKSSCHFANVFLPNWQQKGSIINREPGKYFGELGAVKHARLVPGPPRCAVPLYCLAGWRNPDANGDLRVTCIVISPYPNGVF